MNGQIHVMSIEHPEETLLRSADVIAGGKRQLELLPSGLKAEQIVFGAHTLEQARELVRRAEKEQIAVLASGDPLYFGIGGTLAKLAAPGQLVIHPGPTAFQLLFARLALPWDGAELFSVHGSGEPLPWRRILNADTAAVYGDRNRTAADLARELVLHFPASANRPAAIGCALGTPDENVIRGTLAELGRLEVPALSVLAVLPAPRRPGLPLGLPDTEYAHQNNMITHPEVRAVVLSKLRPAPGVMWDLGAGSGSVGIEAAALAKGLQVFAVEQNSGRAEDIRVNAERHGVEIRLTEGKIADALPALPDPDRIFFGGGSAELETAFARLKPGGILVATAVLVDTVAHLAAALREFRTELLTLNVSRAERTAAGEFLRAENPITIAVYKKE